MIEKLMASCHGILLLDNNLMVDLLFLILGWYSGYLDA